MLTRDEMIAQMESIYQRGVEIVKKKNSDYATNEDALSNFKVIQALGVVDYKRAMLVRMADKFARISNLMKDDKKPAVLDERLEDTLLDLINYSAILIIALGEESDEKIEELDKKAEALWGDTTKGINLLPTNKENPSPRAG
jgi:Nucleotide modification associated domain 1